MHLVHFDKQFLNPYAKSFLYTGFKKLFIVTIASLLFFCTYVLMS